MVSTSTPMKMKGYSKINLMNTNNNSKSQYFSDQTPTPQNPISTKRSPTTTITTQDQAKIPYDDDYDYNHYSGNNNNQEQDEHLSMENLRINQSATDANNLSSRFKIEKQHSTGRTLQTAVKRVLSVRRSSSVSERYARIHDQYVSDPFDVDGVEEDDEVLQMGRSKNIMKKRSSILKACKRIFGL